MKATCCTSFDIYHLVYIFLSCFVFHTDVNDAFRLGAHSKPARGATVLPGTYPNPVVFYKHFVSKGEPLLMKGVLPDSEHKAYTDWTDEYLREQFGSEFVHIEQGKKEDRNRDISSIKFWKFLDVYQDIDLYMVYSVPETMQDDVQVPFTLQCGGFQDNLHDAVIWFSGGDTKSVLHYDAADNIICSLDGMKQLVLIDKKYAGEVMANGFVEEGAYSLVDVDNIDKERFPQLTTVPWVQVNLTKGDCLYIPYKWFHHVYSPPGRNLAVNMWFSHLWWFNDTDCEGVARGTPFKPMSQFQLASPNEQLRTEMLEPFENLDMVQHDEFIKQMTCEDEQDSEKIWTFIDTDQDKTLTWPEMYRFDMDELVSQFPQCFLKPVELEETAIVDYEEEKDDIDDETDKKEAESAKIKRDEIQEELNNVVKKALEENIDLEKFVLETIEEEMFTDFEMESSLEENGVSEELAEQTVEDKGAEIQATEEEEPSAQHAMADRTAEQAQVKEDSQETSEEIKTNKKATNDIHDEF